MSGLLNHHAKIYSFTTAYAYRNTGWMHNRNPYRA